jgi:hypothetical protein
VVSKYVYKVKISVSDPHWSQCGSGICVKSANFCPFHRGVRIRIALRIRFRERQFNAYPDPEYDEQYIQLKNLELVHDEQIYSILS